MAQSSVAAKVVYNRMPQVTGAMRRNASTVVKRTLMLIERLAKASMEGPKHGRVYVRGAITRSVKGKRGRGLKAAGARVRNGRVTVGYTFHRASAPGEAPAVDLGALRESIQGELINELAGVVFTNQVYGPVLEFGGRRMAARPYMKPAAEEGQKHYVVEMAKAIGDAAK